MPFLLGRNLSTLVLRRFGRMTPLGHASVGSKPRCLADRKAVRSRESPQTLLPTAHVRSYSGVSADGAWAEWEDGGRLTDDITAQSGVLDNQHGRQWVWGFSQSGCAVPLGSPSLRDVALAKSSKCRLWTFLDAGTGAHVETTDQLPATTEGKPCKQAESPAPLSGRTQMPISDRGRTRDWGRSEASQVNPAGILVRLQVVAAASYVQVERQAGSAASAKVDQVEALRTRDRDRGHRLRPPGIRLRMW